VGLSYVSAAFRPYLRPFVYGLIGLSSALVVGLCVANQFAAPHSAAAMFTVSAFGLGGGTRKGLRALGLCLGALVGLLLVALALVPEPAVSPWGYGVALAATGATAYAIVRARVRARTLLDERQARYRSVVEHASSGIFLFDGATRRVLEANGAMCRLLGYTPEELRALRLDDLVAVAPGQRTIEANIARAREDRRIAVGLREYRRKDGTTVSVEVNGSVIEEEGRDVFSVTLHDVTEQRRVEAELRAAAARAEEARLTAQQAQAHAEELLRLKSAFLANMSHEIRTPLTAIIGFAEILKEEVPPAQREFVTIIDGAARRLYDTLNSVLDLAQLEGRAVSLRPEALDLAALAREAAGALRPLAERKGLALEVEAPAHPVATQADRGAIARVLNNLIGNAIKFTERGHVRVAVAPDEAGGARLSVVDTGIGMDPASLPRMFEEFRQGSQGYDRSHEGNGLGLAITKRLVDLMGGSVAVESAPGVGTTFTVRLPAGAAPTGGDGVAGAPADAVAIAARAAGEAEGA
jgi:PAS domain S-box-containing protein